MALKKDTNTNDVKALRIGYLWQYHVDMAQPTAPVLHVKAVVRGLQQRGHSVRLVSYRDDHICWTDDLQTWHPATSQRERPVHSRVAESGIRRVQSALKLPYVNYFNSLHFADAAQAALADVDVLYERHWQMSHGGAILSKRLNAPAIYEINGDIIEEYRQLGLELSQAQWSAIRLMNRRLFRHSGHVVTVSDNLRQTMIDGWNIPETKVTTVQNGVDVGLFSTPVQHNGLVERYDLANGPVVVFVGNFMPWHSVDLLIEAFGIAAAQNQDLKLLLVGDGPLRNEAEAQVTALGLEARVIFTGTVQHEDVPKLLSCAQIAVLSHRPSTAAKAGSPIKLFEYMAAGKAVVAPNIENIASVVQDGKHALLVSPNDPSAMAAAFIKLVENPELQAALGDAAQSEVIAKHSWERAVCEIENIMTALL